MVVKYDGSEEQEREVKSLCGFYRFELSMPEGPFPYLEDQPISWHHFWALEDKLLRHFSGIPLDCFRPRGLREDIFHNPWGKLSLHADVL